MVLNMASLHLSPLSLKILHSNVLDLSSSTILLFTFFNLNTITITMQLIQFNAVRPRVGYRYNLINSDSAYRFWFLSILRFNSNVFGGREKK